MHSLSARLQNNNVPLWLTVFGSIALLSIGQFQLADSWTSVIFLNVGGLGLISCLGLSERQRRLNETVIDQLQAAATTDALTDVGNRRSLDAELSRRVALLRRHQTPCSLLVIDVDHFKSINDKWGHGVGDLALKAIAKAVGTALRDTDLVFRLGGEEFVAILAETRSTEAAIVAERIRVAVSQLKIHTGDQAISLTVSQGGAQLYPTDSTASWLKRADEALYAAKRAGRNLAKIAPSGPAPAVELPRPKILT